jgi:glucose-6-phosphate isomerase
MSILETLREQNFIERLQKRDPSLWSDDPAVQRTISQRLGWLTIHRSMLANVRELQELGAWAKELGFLHAVLLGMGGSSLAPEVFQRVFGSAPGHPELIVLDTTDPTAILRVENSVQPESTIFIVSSKSGTTIETASLQRYFGERTLDVTGDTGSLDNFIAVTDPETPLLNQAREAGYHRAFVNAPDVGGRYSALSFFGLVPAAIIGMDVERLLTETDTLDWDEALELGALLAEIYQQKHDKITFLPAPGLDSMGAWLEQLIAESTGKRGQGLIPVDGEEPGPLTVYGNDRAFVYLDIGERNDTIDSTIQALEAAGHPIITTSIDDPYQLGREFLRWEVATAVVAAVMRIDPFDEPNVQESKDNTKRVLEEYIRAGHLPEGTAAIRGDTAAVYGDTGESSVSGAIAAFYRDRRPPNYAAIMAYIPPSEEHDRLLARLRTAIRDSTTIATTAAYGPRFLHSSGQAHKGGPPTGVFLQITTDDAADEDIPGEGFTFSTLKQAQALGDMQALRDRKYPALRVHLRGDTTAALRSLVAEVEADLSPRTAVIGD